MKKTKFEKTIMIIIFLLFFLPDVFAQDMAEKQVLKLDLEKVISLSLETSEKYAVYGNNVSISKAKYKQEYSEILPQINGKLNWSNNMEYPEVASTASTMDYELDGGIGIEQKIFTFGRIFSEIKSAEKAIDADIYNKEALKQEIIYKAKIAYYNAYLAKQVFEITKQSYENSMQNEEILRNRSVGGRVSKYDNIKIYSDIASRKPVVNNALANYYSSLEIVKTMTGINSDKEVELENPILENYDEFEKNQMAAQLYKNQPAIKALEKTVEKKQYLVKAKKGEFYPEISLFGDWKHKGSSDNFTVGNSYLNDYFTAGVKVSVPIWTGMETSSKVAQAELEKENASLEYKQIKKDYLLELNKALIKYKSYLETLKSNMEAVRLAEEAFGLSREMFYSGEISAADLNDAELKLTNEKINEEVTVFNINVTLAEIEKLTLNK